MNKELWQEIGYFAALIIALLLTDWLSGGKGK
jgi:hypothetical protein